jgi:hypothetical protein
MLNLNTTMLKRFFTGLIFFALSQLIYTNAYSQPQYVGPAQLAGIKILGSAGGCLTCHDVDSVPAANKTNVKTDACTAAFSSNHNYNALKTCLTPATPVANVCTSPLILDTASDTCVNPPSVNPISSVGSGIAKPCVKADLTGTWTAVVNDTGSNSTEQCKIIVNSAGKLTSGSCKDIQRNAIYTFRSGSATINSQCNISLTIKFNNGAVSKSTGAISRYRDTIIGTHKNNLGNFGTFSAVKY